MQQSDNSQIQHQIDDFINPLKHRIAALVEECMHLSARVALLERTNAATNDHATNLANDLVAARREIASLTKQAPLPAAANDCQEKAS